MNRAPGRQAVTRLLFYGAIQLTVFATGSGIASARAHTIAVQTNDASLVKSPTILGTWQGTLPIAENPRIVLAISRAEDGSLRGTYTQIDRSQTAMQLSSVGFLAPEVTL